MPVSPLLPPLRRLLPPLLVTLACLARGDEAAWDFAARFDFNAARQALAATAGTAASSSPAQELAQAAALLGTQPRTADNIRRALVLVRELAARPGLDRDSRVNALYLEARIVDLHLEPRSPGEARARYTALLAAYPDDPLASPAAVPLALSLLYDPAPPGSATSETSHPARLAAAEALLRPSLPPVVERDLRYVIGHARLRWGEDTRLARDHLQRAADIGFSQAQRQASLWITVGRLAEETADPGLARRAYQSFLALARRDTRAAEIRDRLAALDPGAGTLPPTEVHP